MINKIAPLPSGTDKAQALRCSRQSLHLSNWKTAFSTATGLPVSYVSSMNIEGKGYLLLHLKRKDEMQK